MMMALPVAVVLALLPLVQCAVIGIDLGGEFIKASLVKPRVPLDIVLNPEVTPFIHRHLPFVDWQAQRASQRASDTDQSQPLLSWSLCSSRPLPLALAGDRSSSAVSSSRCVERTCP